LWFFSVALTGAWWARLPGISPVERLPTAVVDAIATRGIVMEDHLELGEHDMNRSSGMARDKMANLLPYSNG
jgi:hypothetical protein